MQTIRAAERQDEDGNGTGVWDYIQYRGSSPMKSVRRKGYCAGLPATSKQEVEARWGPNAPDTWDPEESYQAKEYLDMIERNQQRVETYGHKYHDDGHESKEAAEECYAQYIFDHKLEYEDDPERYELTSIDDVTERTDPTECEHDDCDQLLSGATIVVAGRSGLRLHLCSQHIYDDEYVFQRCLDNARGTTWVS